MPRSLGMECKEVQGYLDPQAWEGLAAGLKRRIRVHMSGCDGCRSSLASQPGFLETIQRRPPRVGVHPLQALGFMLVVVCVHRLDAWKRGPEVPRTPAPSVVAPTAHADSPATIRLRVPDDTNTLRPMPPACMDRKPWGGDTVYLDDGKTMVVDTCGGLLRVWNLEDMKEIRQFTITTSGSFDFPELAPYPGKSWIVAGSESGIRAWDARTGEKVRTIFDERVDRLAYLPGKKQYLFQCWTGNVNFFVLDPEGGARPRPLLPPGAAEVADTVRDHPLAISRDGDRLAFPDRQGHVEIWDILKSKQIAEFTVTGPPQPGEQPGVEIGALPVRPAFLEGDELLVRVAEGPLEVWSVARGAKVRESPKSLEVDRFRVLPDGRILVLVRGESARLAILEPATFDPVSTLVVEGSGPEPVWILMIPFYPPADRITAFLDRDMILWDVPGRKARLLGL